MFGLTGLSLYLSIGVLVLIVALSGALWLQTNRVEAKQERVDALELAVGAWEQKVAAKDNTIAALQAEIERQNEAIRQGEEWGRLAQERQLTIDRLVAELARAESELEDIAETYLELRARAVGMSECQTYRMALEAIAGVAP